MTDKIERFIKYISETGVSTNTKEAYGRDLRRLEAFCKTRGIIELTDLDAAELMQYIDELRLRGLSAATVSRTVASIRRFFAFALRQGYTFSDPSKLLKAPKVIRKTPMLLSEKEAKRIIAAVDVSSVKGLRDRAILELMLASGIGAGELLNLNTVDVELECRRLTVGKKKRALDIGKRTSKVLSAYAERRSELLTGNKDSGAFFLSCAGERLTRQGLYKLIHTCGINAGLDGVTPITLRHSFAVAALSHGKDANALRQMLGHATAAGVAEYRNLAVRDV